MHPGTPMPAIFRKGQPATLASILDGHPQLQKDALWSYLAKGKNAPDPRSKPPIALAAPAPSQPPQVAQIPLHTPDRGLVESIALLNGDHDLVVYDVGQMRVANVYTGSRLFCREGYGENRAGYFRDFHNTGTPWSTERWKDFTLQLVEAGRPAEALSSQFLGYDRVDGGVRIRSRHRFGATTIDLFETLQVDRTQDLLQRRLRFTGMPQASFLRLRATLHANAATEPFKGIAVQGSTINKTVDGETILRLDPSPQTRHVETLLSYRMPAAEPPLAVPAAPGGQALVDTGEEFFEQDRSRLVRPGYRAVRYPRPKTAAGEDRVMPYALATHPTTGQLFIASNKLGELLTLEDPQDDGTAARFVDYTGGRFQDVFGMLHDGQALYMLHRRNLTRLDDTDGDGVADRFDRVAGIDQAISRQYDWAYGLVRDRGGRFLISLAPWGNAHQSGAGSVLRLPGAADEQVQEIAYGLRNPFGWCLGPERDVFFTDNQGNWVETNKLCVLEEGRFYGYINTEQPQHRTKPRGSTAVWVPYKWAQSINGVTFDDTGGKFGPFAGQFFLAEIMRGGAIVRACVEKVNGVYQGACFPFWGKGLMGPLTLCFDPRGRLFVGSITEPGWLAQPDRGGLFRIDFTGQVPFEFQTIRVKPQGFQLNFTLPAAVDQAADAASYRIEHYRYEYSSNYGSPELDRTPLAIREVRLSANGRTIELDTDPLQQGRVYEIRAPGVFSKRGEPLVHDTGVYTVNELPK